MSKANSFEMVDCPVAELSGMALDYAVAIADGGHSLQTDGITWAVTIDGKTRVLSQGWGSMAYQPSREWQHGGPIIEREQIGFRMNPHVHRAAHGRVNLVHWRGVQGVSTATARLH